MRLLRGLRRLRDDEDGASMVFATITLFALTTAIVFVYQTGLVSADRMQIQTAADAAAYSAAQVEANALNAIGQVDDGMAFVNYLLLRYTVDSIVYSTLNEFTLHSPKPASGKDGYVLMGAQSSPWEGDARFKHIEAIARTDGPIDRGIEWVGDLHFAARVIMAATPRLARETAIKVAEQNGAAYVAVSGDLARGFQIKEHGGGDHAGFGERTASGGAGGPDTFADALIKRYAERLVDHAEAAAPNVRKAAAKQHVVNASEGWFSREQGRSIGPYTQVRLCWNDDDWAHGRGLTGPTHSESPYDQFTQGAPNGHWHQQHSHTVVVGYNTDGTPIFNDVMHAVGAMGPTHFDGGHFMPEDDDAMLHQEAQFAAAQGGGEVPEPHHEAQRCPTCDAKTFSDSPDWTEVQASSDDAGGRSVSGGPRWSDRYTLDFSRKVFPRPLLMRQALLTSGVTVVTWRPARGIGAIMPASPWGMIAIASAAVGYQTDQGVLPLATMAGGSATYDNRVDLVSGDRTLVYLEDGGSPDDRYRNLFYGDAMLDGERTGVRFGARLVPIAHANTWNPDPALTQGAGLKALLEPSGSVWFKVEDARTAVAPPPELAELKKIMQVRDQEGLNALWH